MKTMNKLTLEQKKDLVLNIGTRHKAGKIVSKALKILEKYYKVG